MENREIAAIGYPTLDTDHKVSVDVQRKVLRDRFGVKRMLPGILGQRKKVAGSHGRHVSAVRHDASTMVGASGACIVDVKTGLLVGIHLGNISDQFNVAIPTFELAKDKHIVEAGITFNTEPVIEDSVIWKEFWDAADPMST